MILFYRCNDICNYGDMKGIFNIIKFKYSKNLYKIQFKKLYK